MTRPHGEARTLKRGGPGAIVRTNEEALGRTSQESCGEEIAGFYLNRFLATRERSGRQFNSDGRNPAVINDA